MKESSDQFGRPATNSVPELGRKLSRPFGRRHPKAVTAIRCLVVLTLAIIGVVFCAAGQWWGVLYFPAAAMIGTLAYLMPRWNRVLQAEQGR